MRNVPAVTLICDTQTAFIRRSFFIQQSRPDWSGPLKGDLICHDKKCHFSRRLDLNQRPADYESAALPLKLQQRVAGLSRLSGKQVMYVLFLFYIGEKRNQCVCGASSRFPARRFVHLLDTTSIARIFGKIVSFFSHVSATPYSKIAK